MPWVRNVLIAFGAFWLSLWAVPWLGSILGALNSRIIYGDRWFEAIAMGIMTSMGRASAAVLAVIVTALVIGGRTRERWALIVAALYVVDAPVRYGRWHISPTAWDHLWRAVDFVWPAVACLIALALMTHFRHKTAATLVSQPTP